MYREYGVIIGTSDLSPGGRWLYEFPVISDDFLKKFLSGAIRTGATAVACSNGFLYTKYSNSTNKHKCSGEKRERENNMYRVQRGVDSHSPDAAATAIIRFTDRVPGVNVTLAADDGRRRRVSIRVRLTDQHKRYKNTRRQFGLRYGRQRVWTDTEPRGRHIHDVHTLR